MTVSDIIDRDINLYDIVVVVSANGKLELALVIDLHYEERFIYPVIRRFNKNYELRKKEVIYTKNTIFIANNSAPAGYYRVKLQFMEKNVN